MSEFTIPVIGAFVYFSIPWKREIYVGCGVIVGIYGPVIDVIVNPRLRLPFRKVPKYWAPFGQYSGVRCRDNDGMYDKYGTVRSILGNNAVSLSKVHIGLPRRYVYTCKKVLSQEAKSIKSPIGKVVKLPGGKAGVIVCCYYTPKSFRMIVISTPENGRDDNMYTKITESIEKGIECKKGIECSENAKSAESTESTDYENPLAPILAAFPGKEVHIINYTENYRDYPRNFSPAAQRDELRSLLREKISMRLSADKILSRKIVKYRSNDYEHNNDNRNNNDNSNNNSNNNECIILTTSKGYIIDSNDILKINLSFDKFGKITPAKAKHIQSHLLVRPLLTIDNTKKCAAYISNHAIATTIQFLEYLWHGKVPQTAGYFSDVINFLEGVSDNPGNASCMLWHYEV